MNIRQQQISRCMCAADRKKDELRRAIAMGQENRAIRLFTEITELHDYIHKLMKDELGRLQ